MKSIFLALGRGLLSVVRAWRITLLLWLLQTSAALLVALPIFAVLQKHTAGRPQADALLQRFELSWLADLWPISADTHTLILVLFVTVSALFLVLNIFLSAGVLGVFFHREHPASLAFCLQYAGRYGFRFLRVFVLSVVVYGACLLLYHFTVATWISGAFAENLSEPTVAWANWFKTAGYVLIFAILYVAFVYTKIALVVESSNKVLSTTFRMFRWVFRHLGTICLLGLLLLIPTSALWWAYHTLQSHVSLSASWSLWLGLLALQQLVVWLRGTLRIWFLATQFHFFHDSPSKVAQTQGIDHHTDAGKSHRSGGDHRMEFS